MKDLPLCAHILEYGQFMLSFCRGQQRNVLKYRMHTQDNCFSSLDQSFVLQRCHCRHCCHYLSCLLYIISLNICSRQALRFLCNREISSDTTIFVVQTIRQCGIETSLCCKCITPKSLVGSLVTAITVII